MQSVQSVTVELTERLVGELPRFFGGAPAALRELFQNAHRAGAKNVHITLDKGMLSFEDDGNGCPDPRLLLAAGATGWNEAKVVEPAGLGFFSLLASDVSTSVEVQSSGWRVNLVPKQVLSKKPVLVESGEVHRGLRVRILLANPINDKDVAAARAFYPYNVTLNGETVPPVFDGWQRILQTPVGVVKTMLGRAWFGSRYGQNQVPVWEHRPVEGGAFDDALREAVKDDDDLAAVVHQMHFCWFIDQNSGVLPKLPDRNDLLPGPALTAATRIVLRAVYEDALQQAKELTKGWPDVIKDRSSYAEWLVGSAKPLGRRIMRALGWRRAMHTSYHDVSVYYQDGDGWQLDGTSKDIVYTKKYLEVNKREVAESINYAIALGANLPYAVFNELTGLGVKVIKERGAGLVRVAKDIRVGEHRLPFLCTDDGGPVFVLATDPEGAIAFLSGVEVELPAFGKQAFGESIAEKYFVTEDTSVIYDRSWAKDDDDGEGDYFSSDLACKDLIEELSEEFLSKAVFKARQKLYAAQAELHALGKVSLYGVNDKRLGYGKAQRALKALQKEIQEDIDRYTKAAKLPQ